MPILEIVELGLGEDVDVLAAAVHRHRADRGRRALRERRAAGGARAIAEAEHAARDRQGVRAILRADREGVRLPRAPVDADLPLQGAELLREAVPLAAGLHEANE